MGDQFIQSLDSIAANIAEGYGRYHYLDKTKFYYNSRASLLENKNWIEVMQERNIGNKPKLEKLYSFLQKTHYKLNQFIKSTIESKYK